MGETIEGVYAFAHIFREQTKQNKKDLLTNHIQICNKAIFRGHVSQTKNKQITRNMCTYLYAKPPQYLV